MHAAVVTANEKVEYQEIPEPSVEKGYVKIKVRYSGICGSDIPRVLNHGVHFIPSFWDMSFRRCSGSRRRRDKGESRRPCIRRSPCSLHEMQRLPERKLLSLQTLQLHRFQRAGKQCRLVVVPEQNAVPFDKSVPYDQAAMFEPSTVALHGLFQNDYQAASMWRSWAAELWVCSRCSGRKSSVPEKL